MLTCPTLLYASVKGKLLLAGTQVIFRFSHLCVDMVLLWFSLFIPVNLKKSLGYCLLVRLCAVFTEGGSGKEEAFSRCLRREEPERKELLI